ncbi:MAG TPA: YkgJ family cysteine cluster protein [Haliangiales bacterium]|nr:YkgJ family cysteine cluster protein [Haliangiales bacterium]
MTREAERIMGLIRELLSNAGYVEGRRRFPRTLTPGDAVQIVGIIHGQVDVGCADRAKAAAARKIRIACAEGCNYCCVQPVTVFRAEALRIAAWLRLPQNEAVRDAFVAAYPAWLAAAVDGFEPILDAAARGDVAAQAQAHRRQQVRGVMCAFNREGRCTIYPVRPTTCRDHHATETNERCKVEMRSEREEDGAIGMHFKPLDDFIDQTRALARSMHHALGGPRLRPDALCRAVWEALQNESSTA